MKSHVRGGVGVGVRRAHLVGSIPAATAAEAMRLAVKRLGPELDYLPDGETGVRRNWILGMIEGFRTHPGPPDRGAGPGGAQRVGIRAAPVPRRHEPPRPGAASRRLAAGAAGQRGD